MSIPTSDDLNPNISHASEPKPNGDGNNPGFVIFKFIKGQLNNPSHFKELFLTYTDTISEQKPLYWIIFAICFFINIIYDFFLHLLMGTVLLIVVFGLAKAVGFTDLIYSVFHLQPHNVIQVQYSVPKDLQDSVKSIQNQHNQETKKLENIEKQINNLGEQRQTSRSATIVPTRIVPTTP